VSEVTHCGDDDRDGGRQRQTPGEIADADAVVHRK
jgi:hypothetical protein